MFKEYMATDVSRTFFNQDEFAEEADINGVIVNIVEDSAELEHRLAIRKGEMYDEMSFGDILFYISQEEYKKIPKVKEHPTAGQAIKYKGKACTIVKANTVNGVYEFVLQSIV